MSNPARYAVERLNDHFHLGLGKYARRLLEQLLLNADEHGIVRGISQPQFANALDCSKRAVEYAFAYLREAGVIAESAIDPHTGTMAHALAAWVAEYFSA